MRLKRLFIFITLLTTLSAGFQCSKTKTNPDDLMGVWKTDDPKYADRSFEIERSSITFTIGEGTFDTHPITNIEIEKGVDPKGSLYTIYYKDREGQEFKFSFYYSPSDHGVIRFKNQEQIVWTKEQK